ncbi:MAG: HEAT repeat domain-containing protein [Planctomycetaceae bacterium]
MRDCRYIALLVIASVLVGCGGKPTDPAAVDMEARKLIDRMLETPAKWSGRDRADYFRMAEESQPALTQLGPAALPAMIDGLGKGEGKIGQWLLLPIAKNGESAVMPLATALRDPDFHRRRWALLAISLVANEGTDVSKAGPAILDCTRDADVAIRAASMMAISSAKPDRGVHELIAALNDPEASVRGEAAKILGMVSAVRAPGAIVEEISLPPPTPTVLSEALPPLIAALQDEAPAVRREVAGALGEFGPAAEPALRQAMEDSDGEVRAAALVSLCCVRADGAVEELIDALDDPSQRVRFAGAKWLGLLANPDDLILRRLRPPPLPQIDRSAFAAAVPPLTTALDDKDAGVRSAATKALAIIRPEPMTK